MATRKSIGREDVPRASIRDVCAILIPYKNSIINVDAASFALNSPRFEWHEGYSNQHQRCQRCAAADAAAADCGWADPRDARGPAAHVGGQPRGWNADPRGQ